MNEPLTAEQVAAYPFSETLKQSHELLRAQRDEARARVAELEVLIAQVGDAISPRCDQRFAIERILAALSADPLEIGKAALDLGSDWQITTDQTKYYFRSRYPRIVTMLDRLAAALKGDRNA